MWRLFYTVVCSLLLSGLSSQSLDSTFALAERLYAQERYSEATFFYERARFFSPEEIEVEILYKMGQCYRRSFEAEKALAYFDRVYFTSSEALLKQEALLAKVQSLIQIKRFSLALAEIYASNPANKEQELRFHFYEGICHYARKDFDQSFHSFTAAAGDDSAKVNSIAQLYSDTSSLYRPRPKLAKKMSYFLPGLGQLYSGDLKNGLNSIALNVAMVALAVNVGVNYSLFDAFLAVFPWVQRYYLGGTDKAEMIAKEKLLENRQLFYLEVLQVFDNDSSTTPEPS